MIQMEEIIVTIHHELGEKWSNLIGHIISQGIKSEFGILPKLDFSMNSITIKFSVP
jgi:hypothetical protein